MYMGSMPVLVVGNSAEFRTKIHTERD
jgi:hypothetical protein